MATHPDPGWLNVYQSERAHLARLSQQMIALKTDERSAVLTERTIEALELALNGIVKDLGHDPSDSAVRRVIAHHMREVASSESTARSTSSQKEAAAIIDAEIVADEPLPEPVAF